MDTRATLAMLGREYCVISAICLLSLLSILFFIRKNLESNRGAVHFELAICFSVLAAAMDICYGLREFRLITMTSSAAYATEIAYSVSTILASFSWFIYSETMQRSWLVGSFRRRILCTLPMVLTVAGTFATPWTHHFFYLQDGVYCRGPLFLIHNLLSVLYVEFSGFGALIRSFNKNYYTERNQLRLLFIYSAGIAVTLGIQVIAGSVMPFLTMGITAILVIILVRMLQQRITVDALSRINNRFALDHYLDLKFKSGEPFYLVMMDVDGFKQINDRYGHLTGDRVLTLTASAIAHALPSGYFVARYGGDEFSVVGSGTEEELLELEQSIRDSLETAAAEAELGFPVTLSMGHFRRDDSIATIPDLIRAADENLYRSKNKRKSELLRKAVRR